MPSLRLVHRRELAVFGGDPGGGGALHQHLTLASVAHHIGDEHHLQTVLLAELFQIRQPRHGPVRVLHNLAQNPRGSASSHARQVQRRLGVTRALQHATLAVAKREDVTRTHEVVLVRVRVTETRDGRRAFPRGDPGGGRLEIDADGESGLHGVLVLLAGDHEGRLRRSAGVLGDADEAGGVSNHGACSPVINPPRR